jgi:hypothetical protein
MEPKNPQIRQSSQEDRMRARMANRELSESSRANAAKGVFKPLMSKANENNRELTTRELYKLPVRDLKETYDKFDIETEISGDALKRKVTGKPGKYHTEQ